MIVTPAMSQPSVRIRRLLLATLSLSALAQGCDKIKKATSDSTAAKGGDSTAATTVAADESPRSQLALPVVADPARDGDLILRVNTTGQIRSDAAVKLRAEVRNAKFEAADDAKVSVDVSDGQGPSTTLAMTPVAGQHGVYEANYETAHTGVFRFEAKAQVGKETLGDARVAVRREDGIVEHYHVQQNRPLLERLAAATGGSYFPVADIRRLPEAVSFSDAGSVERQVLDLWNMPIVFLLLLALKAGEWVLRLFWGQCVRCIRS